jgi:Flp pilus assembly protein TadG
MGLARVGQQTRGQVLIIFALSAVAMFGVAALAIDGGRMLMDQRALQNAIDGGALDGALNLGPAAGTTQSANGQDDAVNDIEQDLGISFSSNYSGYGPHRLNGGCSGAACQPPYTAGTITWWDNSTTYKLTVTTPYDYNGSENEAYIHIHIEHSFSLLVGSEFFPTLPIDADVVARNYDLPFAIYTLKYYDPQDYQQQGSNTIQADKDMGTNGSQSSGGSASTIFYCTTLPNGSPGYGGNLYEPYNPTQTLASTHITASSVGSGCLTTSPFPGTGQTSSTVKTGSIQAPPPVRLPPDPYGAAASPAPSTYTISGTEMLQPTIPGTVGGVYGPRYGTVTVPNGTILYLEPGVYFFEGTAAGSGLQIQSGGAVYTGDCYGETIPNCWTPGSGNPPVCVNGVQNPSTITMTQVGSVSGSKLYPCPKDGDFGVLLVFYPHGSDSTVACTSTNPLGTASQEFCPYSTTAPVGADNQMDVTSGGSIYVSSSPKYHNVAVFVDPTHEQGTSWNYTSSTSLSAIGCTTSSCAMQVGVGSQVVFSVGGGSISIIGCILAPDDNIEIGGGGTGKGYGQIISYTLYLHGNGTINEAYNPLSLAYEPVIVK